MADYLAKVTIVTESDGDVVAKICDATTPAQQLAIDASGLIGVNEVAGITSAGQAAMASSFPVVIASDQTDINVDVPNNFLGITSSGQATMANSFPVVLSSDHTDINVDVPNNLLGVTTKGQATMANSLPVVISSDQSAIDVNVVSSVPASPVTDYNTAAAVASGASNTHTYTSTGAFNLSRVFASASGRIKAEVKVGPVGSTVTKAVGFNHASNPNIEFVFDNEIAVPVTEVVEVVRTNRETAPPVAFDVYSFVNGAY